ncbi:MAG: CBS domain-containing protein [Halioglobus sp.]|nr:CBS domain-containing protein [Halioglobus sp.]
MSDDRAGSDSSDRSWLDKITYLFSSEPRTRRDLEDVLTLAVENEIIDQDAHSIMEGAMQVSDMQARDIMIPRSQMVFIKAEGKLEDILPQIIRSAHSRYPVVGDSPDVILGILLAKDLLPQILNLDNGNFKIEELLRPAMVVPESKRLNVLLREFRENRNHMAIVIDEYGGVAGLVTIEDVLEEIVGEIEDETDAQVDRHIHMIDTNEFMVKALTPIEEFNTYFDCDFSDDDFDTIGGLVIQAFGHMPTRHEVTTIEGFKFEVIKADQRKIYSLRMLRLRNQGE